MQGNTKINKKQKSRQENLFQGCEQAGWVVMVLYSSCLRNILIVLLAVWSVEYKNMDASIYFYNSLLYMEGVCGVTHFSLYLTSTIVQ